MALATELTQGEIILAGDLAGDGGAQTGSSPQLTHIVTAGTYTPAQLTVDAKGRITAIGSTISTNINDYIPDATAVSKGVVQVGAGLVVAGGVISIDTLSLPDATAISKGIVEIGSGINVNSGVISIDDATTGTKGVVQIGNYLNVSAGIVNADIAENGSLGVAKSADTNNITITAGAINVGTNVSQLDTAQTFTAAQRVASNSLISGVSVAVDASLSNLFNLTMIGDCELANPSNLVAGQSMLFVIKQDGTGSHTLTFDTSYKFRQGITPVHSGTPDSVDLMSCVFDGTNLYCSYNRGFA